VLSENLIAIYKYTANMVVAVTNMQDTMAFLTENPPLVVGSRVGVVIPSSVEGGEVSESASTVGMTVSAELTEGAEVSSSDVADSAVQLASTPSIVEVMLGIVWLLAAQPPSSQEYPKEQTPLTPRDSLG
jgi:hypothetical protein